MSGDLASETSSSGVSPLRKSVSALVLCVLAIVLVIELRAGLGHMLTGKMLQEKSPDGVFGELPLLEFEPLLIFSPSRGIVRENDTEVEYKYSWFSLLRPLLSRPEAAYYVVVSTDTSQSVRRYNTEPPTEQDMALAASQSEYSDASVDDDMELPGGGGGPGGGGPGGGFDPAAIFDRLDENEDDKLTDEELSGRVQDRIADFDKDSDGELTREEFTEGMREVIARGGGGQRGGRGGDGERQQRRVRPEIEDDTATENEKAADEKAADEKAAE
ncbi:MAG: hypothetical protein P8J37_16795 [Fuerstiella sp.]|nr:hypothetical protein [Fuerstiella sp.]